MSEAVSTAMHPVAGRPWAIVSGWPRTMWPRRRCRNMDRWRRRCLLLQRLTVASHVHKVSGPRDGAQLLRIVGAVFPFQTTHWLILRWFAYYALLLRFYGEHARAVLQLSHGGVPYANFSRFVLLALTVLYISATTHGGSGVSGPGLKDNIICGLLPRPRECSEHSKPDTGSQLHT